MVRLLQIHLSPTNQTLPGFNPTMVRLLRCYELQLPFVLLSSFQSHNGAIAAKDVWESAMSLRSFNPTMVRLLRRNPRRHADSWGGFNPTMVRLLHGCDLCD